jgi:uncharacterized protein (TIGR02996 family)
MTQADTFVQAILDDPDDDAPRLIYADWLDEHGDPARAEFIRVQIALARRRPGALIAELSARERELLAAHQNEWAAPVRDLVPCSDCRFHRGFIEEIEVGIQKLLACADDLFQRVPLRRLNLMLTPRENWEKVYEVRLLVECPALTRLVNLDLSGNGIGSDGVQALAVSPYLTRLTTLNLSQCRIGDRGARALAESPLLSRLVDLDLSDNDIGPGGVRALARALEAQAATGEAPRLRRLLLQGNPIGEAGRRAVRASPLLRRATNL